MADPEGLKPSTKGYRTPFFFTKNIIDQHYIYVYPLNGTLARQY